MTYSDGRVERHTATGALSALIDKIPSESRTLLMVCQTEKVY